METVVLKPLTHRGQEIIGIYSPQKGVLNHIFQKKANARWTKTHRCWYIPCNEESYNLLARSLKGIAKLETEDLKKYLLKRKRNNDKADPVLASLSSGRQGGPVVVIPGQKATVKFPHKYLPPTAIINDENKQQLGKFIQQLQLKAYSPSTIRTYRNEFMQLLQMLGNVPAQNLQPEHLQRYLVWCMQNGLTENTIHSRLNALKFYYEQVLHRDKFFFEIPRPKKPDQLPKVLAENEIGRMFNAISNLKHKAILFTAYSAGLRVSEVVHLKMQDVDSDRMQLRIENSKGKKDRYVGLSILLLDILRSYLKSSKPRPKKYVFENPLLPGEPYSIRSAQQIFQNAKQKAMINKKVGIHSLRHSFATHLLEKGIDIRYIKDLLGHFNIKTTERYLHVKRETLVNIPNVLDELNKSITLEW